MVVCVVVNWNGWRDTLACVRTLTTQSWQPLQVIVVDNGSTDDSVAQIRSFIADNEGAATQLSVVESSTNVGYATGANLGVREALKRGAEFVWLLNNDTECPPDTLEKLVRTANQLPGAGIIGTVLYYHSDPAKVQAWGGGRIQRWSGVAVHAYAPIALVRGSYTTFASVLVRAEVFREIGLLHEGYFMYYDDSDFCLRMERTRWKIGIATETAVLHKESASTEGPRHPFMEKTIAVSGMRFLKRHSPVPWFSIPLFVILKLGNRIRLGEWAACRAVLQAVGEYARVKRS
jgi:GT2 family glycosyltransferase